MTFDFQRFRFGLSLLLGPPLSPIYRGARGWGNDFDVAAGERHRPIQGTHTSFPPPPSWAPAKRRGMNNTPSTERPRLPLTFPDIITATIHPHPYNREADMVTAAARIRAALGRSYAEAPEACDDFERLFSTLVHMGGGVIAREHGGHTMSDELTEDERRSAERRIQMLPYHMARLVKPLFAQAVGCKEAMDALPPGVREAAKKTSCISLPVPLLVAILGDFILMGKRLHDLGVIDMHVDPDELHAMLCQDDTCKHRFGHIMKAGGVGDKS